jgi:hypothetical protein
VQVQLVAVPDLANKWCRGWESNPHSVARTGF